MQTGGCKSSKRVIWHGINIIKLEVGVQPHTGLLCPTAKVPSDFTEQETWWVESRTGRFGEEKIAQFLHK